MLLGIGVCRIFGRSRLRSWIEETIHRVSACESDCFLLGKH